MFGKLHQTQQYRLETMVNIYLRKRPAFKIPNSYLGDAYLFQYNDLIYVSSSYLILKKRTLVITSLQWFYGDGAMYSWLQVIAFVAQYVPLPV